MTLRLRLVIGSLVLFLALAGVVAVNAQGGDEWEAAASQPAQPLAPPAGFNLKAPYRSEDVQFLQTLSRGFTNSLFDASWQQFKPQATTASKGSSKIWIDSWGFFAIPGASYLSYPDERGEIVHTNLDGYEGVETFYVDPGTIVVDCAGEVWVAEDGAWTLVFDPYLQ